MTIPSSNTGLNHVNNELLRQENLQIAMDDRIARQLSANNYGYSSNYGMNAFHNVNRNPYRLLFRNTTNGVQTPSPVNNWYRRILYKMIITASELQDMGLKTLSTIYGLTIHITQTPTYQPYPDYRIYLINTGVSPGNDITSGWTNVYYSASQSFSTGEFTFTFNQATFDYVTGNNLGICFAWGQSPTTYSPTGQCYIDTVNGANVANYAWTDSAGTWVATDAATSTTSGRAYVALLARNVFDVPLSTTNSLPGTYHSITEPGPCENWYRRCVFKAIYTPAEIRQALGGGGTGSNPTTINNIAIYVGTPPTYQPFPDYRIGMANTGQGVGGDETGHTQVYYNASQSFSSGWINFGLGSTFEWNGTSNLSISFAWGQCPTNYSQSGTSMIASGSGSSRYSWTDAAGAFGINDSASSSISYRPVLRLQAVS